MKTHSSFRLKRAAPWALGAAVLLCVGMAHAAGKLSIENTVFQEVQVQTDDGRTETRQVPANRVVPGTEVIYVIDYSNVGDGPVENVAITNPLPAQLLYVGAAGPVQVTEVSVDGGEIYGDLSDLSVTGDDGEPRAAEARDVTHLRWMLPELPAGGTGAVSFKARVR